jgi:hypothetical protein
VSRVLPRGLLEQTLAALVQRERLPELVQRLDQGAYFVGLAS